MTTDVFGVPIDRLDMDEALHELWDFVRDGIGGFSVCLVNAQSVVEAQANPAHMNALRYADLCLADGWPIARLARTPKIAGADLMLAAARHPELGKMRHVLLGGFGVAYKASAKMFQASGQPYGMPWIPDTSASDDSLVAWANLVSCDVLWLCLGCPKQEIWMHENRDKLNAKVVIGVGAAFDFLAGRVRRAPVWVQQVGMEWAWRVVQEPKRWRRQMGAVTGFLRLLLR